MLGFRDAVERLRLRKNVIICALCLFFFAYYPNEASYWHILIKFGNKVNTYTYYTSLRAASSVGVYVGVHGCSSEVKVREKCEHLCCVLVILCFLPQCGLLLAHPGKIWQ
jgi:hypothetical protein